VLPEQNSCGGRVSEGSQRYVVDHIVPLECGGADVSSNMQWQTVQEAD
jgi:hypothetical protein